MNAPGNVHLHRRVLIAAAAYVIAVSLIAFWPTHVDEGARWVLETLHRGFPWITYPRVEFAANVLLFVPFGWLLARLFPTTPMVAAPLALGSSLMIELIQATLLPGRTPSLRDVIANTVGAVIGLLLALLIDRILARPRHQRETRRVAG